MPCLKERQKEAEGKSSDDSPARRLTAVVGQPAVSSVSSGSCVQSRALPERRLQWAGADQGLLSPQHRPDLGEVVPEDHPRAAERCRGEEL